MTKTSKILTIVVTMGSVLFMAVAAVLSTVRTDWKEKATKEFPRSRITDQKAQLDDLDKEIKSVARLQADADAGIAADSLAITTPTTGRVAQLESELQKLIDEAHKLAEQVEAEAKTVDEKQDRDKRLREEVARLQSQYEDLVAEKENSLANVKRLRDLLFQAQGVLDRVQKRQKALNSEGLY
jgi:chromosome segregation ATPase